MASQPPPQFEHFRVMTRPDGTEWVLGRGGMGVTYRALDLKLGRQVALKVIDSSRLLDEAGRQRFLREAKANALLHHRNIAAVYHQGQVGESCYYAMELIEGVTLQHVLKERGALPLLEALEITRQAAQALSEAEKHGLVHRDIKPANLMLKQESDGELVVKLIDFGLVKAVSREAGDTQITVDGGYLGTAMTSSPEQCRGEDVDTRSDIYSLGVVLWYMIEGRPPFEDPNHFRLMMAHLETEPPFERIASVPEPVRELLACMLAKKREDRPSTTVELLQRITAIRQGLERPAFAAEAGDAPTQAAIPEMVVKDSGFPWISTVLGVVLLGVAGFVAWQIRQTPATVEAPEGPRLDVNQMTGPAVTGDGLLEHLTRLGEAVKASDWADALETAAGLPAQATNSSRAEQVNRALEDLARRLLARPSTEWRADVVSHAVALRGWAEQGDRPAVRLMLARAMRESDPAASAQLVANLKPASITDFFLRLEWQAARYLGATNETTRTEWEAGLLETLSGFDRYSGDTWKPGRAALQSLVDAGHVPSMLVLGRKTDDPAEAQLTLMNAARLLDKPGQWAAALVVYLDLIRLSPDASVVSLMKDRVGLLARGFLEKPDSLTPASWLANRAHFERAAEAGIPDAAELVGRRLLADDATAAAAWLAKAAEAGSPSAMVLIAQMHERGQGVAANREVASAWFDKAAQAGHPEALWVVGQRLVAAADPSAQARGIAMLERAAGLRLPAAVEALAEAVRGGRGGKADAVRARQLYQQAADLGSASALGHLGMMVLNGEGGPADATQAIALLREGANRRNPWCQFLLGHALWEGTAAPQDRDRATALLREAASGGVAEARRFCEQNGIRVP